LVWQYISVACVFFCARIGLQLVEKHNDLTWAEDTAEYDSKIEDIGPSYPNKDSTPSCREICCYDVRGVDDLFPRNCNRFPRQMSRVVVCLYSHTFSYSRDNVGEIWPFLQVKLVSAFTYFLVLPDLKSARSGRGYTGNGLYH